MTAIGKEIDDYLAALAASRKAKMHPEIYGARLRRFAHWCASGDERRQCLTAQN